MTVVRSSRVRFRAGDAFVCPSGFTGTWHVLETAKKYYAYYE
ncbi:MAG: cupin domain-containing protein [Hyphomicrobium sp.]